MKLDRATSTDRSTWARTLRFCRTKFVDPLLYSRKSPAFDARGVSLGLVIGFIIPVGGQLFFLAFVRSVLRFNYMVAAGFTFVSNPLNMIPLYYGYYWLGSILLMKPVSLDFRVFQDVLTPVMEKEYFWESLSAFMTLGWEILIRWLVAAVVLAIFFGTVGYVATYAIQKKRCMKAAQALGLSWDEYLEILKQDAAERNS